ncbi:fumarylacetoacetate hydrolase family protein [Streptomyces coeruleorubidus]|uniref:fumarylacetoacetate hydrolase family protein n=1 Tax=Streptomyces coeruleorubidus TaxID=116188 RepID=UPI0018754C65|nr:fumarylacetoacetate hydrolase family protein [Streptomyces bellus]GGU45295.1 hypothetical protein GCM10010244_84030 [Streptomyces bellus]
MNRLVSTAKRIGRLEDDGETVALLDLDAADLGAALQAGLDIAPNATASVRDRVPVAQAQLIAPVPRPVDDVLRQDARTSQLIHPVPALVSYVPRQTPLEPGDEIATGTPAGVGHKEGRFLQSGTESASRSRASAPLSTPALD